jgi:hypothetical protein
MLRLSLSLAALLSVVEDALEETVLLSVITPAELVAEELAALLVLVVELELVVEFAFVLELVLLLELVEVDVIVPTVLVVESLPIFGLTIEICLPLALSVNPNLVKSI